MRRRAFLLLMPAFAASVVAAQSPPDAKKARVLFIGNAITSAMELPARVAKAAATTGRTVTVDSVAIDGYSLEDHWRQGDALAAIKRGWDIVVLQQDGIAGAETRDSLTRDVKRFADAIREAGARPALFMPWPRPDHLQDFRDVIAAHRAAAESSNALLIPAGEAWLRALGADRRAKLYGDGPRPAPLGIELAVLTAYLSLFPAGPQEFDEAFVQRIATALDIPAPRRDQVFDAATRSIDEPLAIKGSSSP
jgi:hypothetical protein